MGNAARGDFAADGGAGDDFAVERNRGDDFDGESVAGAEFAEQGDVAGLLVAEAEILSDQDGADVQSAYQDLFDEFLGRETREIEREGKDHGGFQADGAEPSHALGVGGNTERSGFRAEDFARGRVEGQRGGDVVGLRGALDGGAENGLVAQVNAVKIPDGEDAAATGCGVVRGPLLWRTESKHLGGGRLRDASAGAARRKSEYVHANVELQAIVGQLDVLQAELAQTIVGFSVR